jgi:hypothetical protein
MRWDFSPHAMFMPESVRQAVRSLFSNRRELPSGRNVEPPFTALMWRFACHRKMDGQPIKKY